MPPLRLLAAGFAVFLNACGKPSTGTAGMPRHDIEAKLLSITGLRIPATAAGVSGIETTAFTHVFDCSFECSLADLKHAWNEAPKLREVLAAEKLAPRPPAAPPVFEEDWPVQGGTWSVGISLLERDAGMVRVEVKTTHETQ